MEILNFVFQPEDFRFRWQKSHLTWCHKFPMVVTTLNMLSLDIRNPLYLFYHRKISLYADGVQPNMYPSISFSDMYWKLLILRKNGTNFWYRACMYFSDWLFCLFVRLKISILDPHMFSNFAIMKFDYDYCCVLVQKL